MPGTLRARFVVRGLVQGVNFRAAAVREATARRITGRVWNRDDGAVELIAEGEEAALADLGRWLRVGPRLAEVASVERADLGGEHRYRDFAITYGPASD
ncbi:MAG TPA: acylphosphatase [Candidatus Limnocylindria bacterium]|nr:acylphosphatase [Candidatus Limnocylindria bacterium]